MYDGWESALKTTQPVESSLYVSFALSIDRICRGWVTMSPNSGCHRTRGLPGSGWMPCPGRPVPLHRSTCPGQPPVPTCRASVRPCHLPLCCRRPCKQASKCLKAKPAVLIRLQSTQHGQSVMRYLRSDASCVSYSVG